jgi:hypothetical protein
MEASRGDNKKSEVKMTYSNGLKSVVSDYGTERYIQEQQGKDVFEYSVFGSPQQKICDFTQSKLARWAA